MNHNIISKSVLSLCLLLLSITLTVAQNVEFSKEFFKNDKEGFREAMKNIDAGNQLFEKASTGTYLKALDYYLKANKFNPNNAELNYKIGVCYVNSINKEKSIDYLKKSYELDKNLTPDIHFYFARAYHLNYEFNKAIESYNNYKNALTDNELDEKREEINKYIKECNNGIEFIKNPTRVFIDNLGPNINSKFPEYGPIITADESAMYFTSRRNETTGGTINDFDNQYAEDIYFSANDSGVWSPVKNVGEPLNSNDNDAALALSPDGQQLFIFSNLSGDGDILVSELKGNAWSKPTKLGKNINTEYRESAASFSYDGKTIYFCSEKPDDNFGNIDIFMSKKDKLGRWGKAENIGKTINTEYKETGVFMHPDGKTLYFSSKGHNSMGGYDIFKSTLQDDGTWSKPENLGYPINTTDDDVFFVLNGNGKHGYYSSAKEGGIGGYDNYMITFLGPEKPLILGNEDNLISIIANPIRETIIEKAIEIKTTRLTILKGLILDAITKNPLEAEIEIVDNDKNEIVSVSTSNSSTGKFLVSLPSGKNYGIAVKAKDYLFHSENFDIPATSNYQEVNKEILLNKMEVGVKIILKNIFFDLAKSDLRPTSYPELERVIKMLTDFPTVRIEISGHTDSLGTLATNKKLSEARAKSVVDYLISKGIDTSRLEFKGYAYFQPVATNSTEEGRQENRRVEFKILSK